MYNILKSFWIKLVFQKSTGEDATEHMDSAINLVRITLSVFSVSYNVYLYIIYNSMFRHEFRKRLCRCLRKVGPEDDNSIQSYSATAPSMRVANTQGKNPSTMPLTSKDGVSSCKNNATGLSNVIEGQSSKTEKSGKSVKSNGNLFIASISETV